MRSAILSILAVASFALAQEAHVVSNNPSGVSYVAKLPTKEGSTLSGSVTATSSADGKGVSLAVAIEGLPKEGGPFMYHIHEKPVAADGNCSSTGAHLDPYKRGEKPACDASKPQTCQTGDLSGKHGNITDAQALHVTYTDLYLATSPEDLSFLGNLSIVVHLSDKKRIGCANFVLNTPSVSSTIGTASSGFALPTGSASSGYAIPTGTNGTSSITLSGTRGPTPTPTGPTVPSATSALPSSGAQKLVAGAGALAGLAALIL
ncbi:Cu,Zn superoxide dismutase-like protein [Pleomassaria siparia CBS 279.74]|uniref:superoxide dismutase n=1 Tax=Pleomassaria siparia CBS 279.74 TaxID=1314801 RepID=A0A6G1K363_9PLEO|nr:Cu,Zn superoxide dismutase-like protein [Pleomassaria siparia CBS 279.74]